jgi:magnesium transporter
MNDELNEKINNFLAERKFTELRNELKEVTIVDVVDFLRDAQTVDRAVVFRLLPNEIAADVFSELSWEQQNQLLKDLNDEETRQLLADLKPDDRTHLFEEMPGLITQRFLNLLSPEDLKETRTLLGYPEESVGRVMTPDYIIVRPDWTVSRALKHLRLKGKESETINTVYVVDNKWKLVGVVSLKTLVLASPAVLVSDLMEDQVFKLTAFEDREAAVSLMESSNLSILPVVDSRGVMIGIVTFDDVLDIAEEEATEDFHKGAAIAPLRSSYQETSVWELFRKRIGWLIALVFVSLMSSGVIAAFEEVLLSAVALAFFIPLLIGTGGNTGAQSATLMVRAIAVGDIKMTNWFKVFIKEIFVGLSIGLAMAVAGFTLGIFRGGYEVGIIVGLSMMLIIVVANIIGALLPFVLSRFKIDPAVASGPLVASIVDATGLLIYFSLATAIIL